MRPDPRRLLRFWLDEVGPPGWFGGGPALDARIARDWGTAWRMAHAGAYGSWEATPEGALALAILTDQFPRNLHRGSPLAFATDARAVALGRRALTLGHDRRLPEAQRLFLYLPFEHSESLADQDLSVRLFAARMPTEPGYLLHARAHRAVIRRFGRFPFRNAALGRADSPEEAEWLAEGGYMAEVRRLGG